MSDGAMFFVGLFGGLVFGFIAGNNAGWNQHSRELDGWCQKGFVWKTLDFKYSCTAEKRP
jgi:hypothetical protein